MNEQHVSPSPSIAVVGAGPRGTSLLERLGANLSADHAPDPHATATVTLDVHVIDDAPSGAGRIWRTDQPRDLCMNTLAHAVTLFTEPGASIAGPVCEGPTLYEWGVLVRSAAGSAGADNPAPKMCGDESALDRPISGIFPAHSGSGREPSDIPTAHSAAFAAHPVRAGLAADYRDELAQLRPESHPSRAFYGEYLAWCFDRAVSLLPDWVRVTRHRARAVGIERVTRISARSADTANPAGDGTPQAVERDHITLDDGSAVTADAVVLATGWLPTTDSAAERALTSQVAATRRRPSGAPAATWVRPASPIEQDLSEIEAGQAVVMRGLGMSFFDTLSLLTLGRGGRFETDAEAPGGLRYVATGAEPVVFATSRRGVPFRSKSLYGGLPPRPAQRFLRAVDWAHEPRPINFDRRLWPRIVGDAFLDHALTLARVRPGSVVAQPTAPQASQATHEAPVFAQLEAALAQAIDELERSAGADTAHADLLHTVDRISTTVAPFIADPADRFDLAGELDPAQAQFASPAAFDAWVRERVAADLHEAERGLDSPVKAGLWSVSAARGVASRIGTLGGFDAESRASGFGLLFDVGGMVGSGPPAFRNRQLLALAEAGLVRFVGPAAQVSVVAETYLATTASASPRFVAESPRVAGSRVEAPALVDAWMHFHSLDATADPLSLALLGTGRARSFRVAARTVPSSPGEPGAHRPGTVATGGFDIDPASGRLVRADGTLDPAVHVAGIPADQTLHDTVISPMPGTDPPMLRETDRVARSAIRIALTSHPNPVLPLAAEKEGATRA
ncbi:FAD/NAD(P)-binding protein [Leucobacter salsicius]|uniref:FAD/NAD(P)-binding protein n=1 Tax=Leucobacter salsicius TaxID=664638 RepID=UPI00034537EF|nr:FAD/NAD(P)-binding protein [Leucobacter salsicius]